jgi:hypothetical protein
MLSLWPGGAARFPLAQDSLDAGVDVTELEVPDDLAY